MAWLPLMEFSSKFGISVSTLRRRIRARAITYKIVDGKYLILEEEDDVEKNSAAESRGSHLESSGRGIPLSQSQFQTPQPPIQGKNMSPASSNKSNLNWPDSFQTFFHDAQKMLEEIKKAYTLILQEKEEQICELKDEISDLRTLVRVLETENERLKTREAK